MIVLCVQREGHMQVRGQGGGGESKAKTATTSVGTPYIHMHMMSVRRDQPFMHEYQLGQRVVQIVELQKRSL